MMKNVVLLSAIALLSHKTSASLRSSDDTINTNVGMNAIHYGDINQFNLCSFSVVQLETGEVFGLTAGHCTSGTDWATLWFGDAINLGNLIPAFVRYVKFHTYPKKNEP